MDNNACLSIVVPTPPTRDLVEERYVDDTDDARVDILEPEAPPLAVLDCDVFRVRLVPVGVTDGMMVEKDVPSNSR